MLLDQELKERKGQSDLIFLVLQQRVKSTSMVFIGEWRVISLAGFMSYCLSQRLNNFNILGVSITKVISKQI